MTGTKTIYLSLGSNVGEREKNLAAAMAVMGEAGIHVVKQSSLYATEPVELREQPWFLNCCVEAETSLMPQQLLHVLQGIALRIGGRKIVRKGPRAIDIDILLYGSSTVRLPELTIPHPRMTERRFVLAPLAEIAPAARHPLLQRTVAELLAECKDTAQVRRVLHPSAPSEQNLR